MWIRVLKVELLESQRQEAVPGRMADNSPKAGRRGHRCKGRLMGVVDGHGGGAYERRG